MKEAERDKTKKLTKKYSFIKNNHLAITNPSVQIKIAEYISYLKDSSAFYRENAATVLVPERIHVIRALRSLDFLVEYEISLEKVLKPWYREDSTYVELMKSILVILKKGIFVDVNFFKKYSKFSLSPNSEALSKSSTLYLQSHGLFYSERNYHEQFAREQGYLLSVGSSASQGK